VGDRLIARVVFALHNQSYNLVYALCIQEEIMGRLKSGNACYHSVQNLLSSYLKIKIYKTIIFPVVLYGCETWWLTLWEERRLWMFETRVLRRIFGPKRDEVNRGVEKTT